MNSIADAALAFKKGGYRYYAPWLFKAYSFVASSKLWFGKYDQSQKENYVQFLWNQFLYKNMTNCVDRSGEKVLQIERKPQNKTAYILGCGPSINRLTDDDWSVIKDGYSVGVNNFFIHDFTPDTYFCEFVDNPAFLSLVYERLLNNPERAHCQVNLAGRYVVFRSKIYKKPTQVEPTFYFSQPARFQDKRLLSALMREYYLGDTPLLSHHISNLDTVINYCVRAGFKKIVLLGVDLTNDGYFWDYGEQVNYLQGRAMIQAYQKELNYRTDVSGHHATASSQTAKKLGKLTIVDYLTLIQEQFLLPNDINLSIANPQSLLANVLPVESTFQEKQR